MFLHVDSEDSVRLGFVMRWLKIKLFTRRTA